MQGRGSTDPSKPANLELALQRNPLLPRKLQSFTKEYALHLRLQEKLLLCSSATRGNPHSWLASNKLLTTCVICQLSHLARGLSAAERALRRWTRSTSRLSLPAPTGGTPSSQEATKLRGHQWWLLLRATEGNLRSCSQVRVGQVLLFQATSFCGSPTGVAGIALRLVVLSGICR